MKAVILALNHGRFRASLKIHSDQSTGNSGTVVVQEAMHPTWCITDINDQGFQTEPADLKGER